MFHMLALNSSVIHASRRDLLSKGFSCQRYPLRNKLSLVIIDNTVAMSFK